MFASRSLLASLLFALVAAIAFADGPADNIPDNVRPVPPIGNDIPQADQDEIKKGLAELQAEIMLLPKHELLPDVLIYEKAVRWALEYKEIYDGKGAKPAANVKKVLKDGLDRAKAMKDGKTPWTTQTGGVLRGYRSKIDGSVQPYWIIVPKEFDFAGKEKHRLDFWWHGRGETLSEANFMANSPGAGGGIIPVPGQFILHPYGRYCCANKFAGEVDTFECLEHAKKHYRIDENRLVARGFSMGGAACWQYAVHFPTLWCANAPGAGFSETPEFLKVFQKEDVQPTWYEQKLWHMHNCTDYAVNIYNLPTVAYSGEVDSQKQAADVMEREMKKVGLDLVHIIGPKTGHSYEKGAKEEVNKRIDAIVAKGKNTWSNHIRFTTYTLQYNQCAWITIDGLEKHWEPATVEAITGNRNITITTKGVSAITINETVGGTIDGSPYNTKGSYRKVNGKWVSAEKQDGLVKKHGLQGPIDDAFMDSFLMVKPTGAPMNEKIGKWVDSEMKHTADHWRKQFRGDAPMKADKDITDEDIKNNNLILWGDPKSNAILAKIADKLPLKEFGDSTVQILIYPNPLNPSKYVVLNSGFTFREYDYLNNARQVSKLPDYAVIDVTTPPNSRYPGRVVRAGFFGEKWELLPKDGQ